MLRKRNRQCWLALLVGMAVILGFSVQALAADKNYAPPKALLDQVKAEGSELNIYDWAEWYPEELYEGFSKEQIERYKREAREMYDPELVAESERRIGKMSKARNYAEEVA